ncbi:MAG: hypothetical protein ACXVY5_10220 [Gaiellales bacterium]
MGARNTEGRELGRFPGILLESDLVTAGDPVSGRVAGLTRPARISLLRAEDSPAGRAELRVAAREVEPAAGAVPFVLDLPEDAPPTVAGRRCAVSYLIRARSPASGRRSQIAEVPVTVRGTGARTHIDSHLYDRVIANYPARHFHIELADAVIEGGGSITGRVHLHDVHRVESLTVTVRCYETWRTSHSVWTARHPPLWSDARLWQAEVEVATDPDRTWVPFHFDLPEDAPPAVEARTLGWRYEIEARRPVRFAPDERGVVTLLRFEVA